MAHDEKSSFDRNWKEYWGRRKIIDPIPFTETSILTQPTSIRVEGSGHFLQLPANTAGIITSSTGHKQVFIEGGFFNLEEGAYTVQYIDLSERFITLPKITASTKDGSNVSLTVSISYKVNDPTQIISVASPLQTLFSVCEAAVKNFIITHRHDELVGELGMEQYVADHEIVQDLKEQVAINQACRTFWVMNVIIKERSGNLEIGKIKHNSLVQEKKNITERQNVIQKQAIAEEEKILATTKAEQDRIVKEVKAQAEARQSEILEESNRLRVELENLRKHPDIQHEQVLRKVDALEKALEALIRAYVESGFTRGLNEGGVIESFSRSLADIQNDVPRITSERARPVNELGSTIINLIAPKKKD